MGLGYPGYPGCLGCLDWLAGCMEKFYTHPFGRILSMHQVSPPRIYLLAYWAGLE